MCGKYFCKETELYSGILLRKRKKVDITIMFAQEVINSLSSKIGIPRRSVVRKVLKLMSINVSLVI